MFILVIGGHLDKGTELSITKCLVFWDCARKSLGIDLIYTN